MYTLLMIVHVIVSLVLILVILLQAGKGGGLSDMFGGGSAQTFLGSKANEFLTKATSVCAVLFILTSLTLTILSSHRTGSLMERGVVPMPQTTTTEQPVEQPPQTPETTPAP